MESWIRVSNAPLPTIAPMILRIPLEVEEEKEMRDYHLTYLLYNDLIYFKNNLD